MNQRLQQDTARHYDTNPFEFMTAEDEARIGAMQPAPFIEFVEKFLQPNELVADIGCGPGRTSAYLGALGFPVLAFDLSHVSLLLTGKRAPGACRVQGTNLGLPFIDGCFDAVVSDGVIHHTPDARRSFGELARVLKAGGYLYLGVYRRHRYYYYLYTYLGVPVRWLARCGWGRILIHTTLLPVYFAVHWLKTGGRRSWAGAKNFFYDYLITPHASFHTREQIEVWGRQEGLDLLAYFPEIGNVHAFVFRKLLVAKYKAEKTAGRP